MRKRKERIGAGIEHALMGHRFARGLLIFFCQHKTVRFPFIPKVHFLLLQGLFWKCTLNGYTIRWSVVSAVLKALNMYGDAPPPRKTPSLETKEALQHAIPAVGLVICTVVGSALWRMESVELTAANVARVR